MVGVRIFIAIPLPEEVKQELKNIQKEILNTQKDNFKYSVTKDFHLTLKFLGDVSEKEIEKIKEAFSMIRFNEFELDLDKSGFFPNENYIKVVWIGLEPQNQVNELQEKVDSATPDFRSNNKFHPHLTLFRAKFIKDKQVFKEAIKSINIKPTKFKVDSFNLYKSTLMPEGPVYDILKQFNCDK